MKIQIITISDTRNLETDLSGQKIEAMLADAQLPADRILVHDDIAEIRDAFAASTAADVIIANGGTGIAKRDVTFEAVQPFVSQELPGFGEIFRQLSFLDIGSHAIASRAMAFFNRSDQLIFILPGSTKACELAVSQLILPEMEHLLYERRK